MTFILDDPLAERVSPPIMAENLIHRINWGAAGVGAKYPPITGMQARGVLF